MRHIGSNPLPPSQKPSLRKEGMSHDEMVIGRRVLWFDEIVTIINNPEDPNSPMRWWVRRLPRLYQQRGEEFFVDPKNLRPLPGGQW